MRPKKLLATCLLGGALVLATPSAALAGLIGDVTLSGNTVTVARDVTLNSNDCNVLVASICDED